MAEGSVHADGKSTIPYFFYDVISFIIPGALLLLGGLAIAFGRDWSCAFYSWLQSSHEEGSITAIGVILGIAFLLFLAVSAAIGFLLSSLSYQIIDRPWKWKWPHSLPGMSDFMGGGVDSNVRLNKAYLENFGEQLTERSDIDRASALCEYLIWHRNPTLGVITARFDAEKIMSQSLILVGVILLVETVFQDWAATPKMLCISIFAAMTCASIFAFHYHRRKRVYARFLVFLAISQGNDDNASAPG